MPLSSRPIPHANRARPRIANLSSRSSSGGGSGSSRVDEFAVVELGGRSFVGLGQREAEADGGLRLLDLGIASFAVPEGTPATS